MVFACQLYRSQDSNFNLHRYNQRLDKSQFWWNQTFEALSFFFILLVMAIQKLVFCLAWTLLCTASPMPQTFIKFGWPASPVDWPVLPAAQPEFVPRPTPVAFVPGNVFPPAPRMKSGMSSMAATPNSLNGQVAQRQLPKEPNTRVHNGPTPRLANQQISKWKEKKIKSIELVNLITCFFFHI